MSREFRPGQVIAYPYLWAWQHERGETEGRKSRPACVVVALRGAKDDLTHLALLAITTQPPPAERVAVEVSIRKLAPGLCGKIDATLLGRL